MSGGVDSSIAAAILKRKGHEVIGVFMKFWIPRPAYRRGRQARDKQLENKCCSAEAQADARKIATKLNIPFYTLNFEKEFKKRVVDYFIKEYKVGRTPNPCVECNRWIKFGFLMEKAMGLKADYIATGHYARAKNGKLFTAKDKQKDQSYFLWTLTQKQLKRTLFPAGDYTKKQVRAMAKKWDLSVFKKKDSQEICFIHKSVEDFLRKRIKTKRGDIITVDNKKVGEHEGLVFYTIGQRKGIKIGGIGPFYVVEKDFKNNTLIVAKSEHASELHKKEMIVENVNWINKVKLTLRCRTKIRYLTEAMPCIVMNHELGIMNHVRVIFDKPQRAITPGQSAVFYKGNEVLGGGIIQC